MGTPNPSYSYLWKKVAKTTRTLGLMYLICVTLGRSLIERQLLLQRSTYIISKTWSIVMFGTYYSLVALSTAQREFRWLRQWMLLKLSNSFSCWTWICMISAQNPFLNIIKHFQNDVFLNNFVLKLFPVCWWSSGLKWAQEVINHCQTGNNKFLCSRK